MTDSVTREVRSRVMGAVKNKHTKFEDSVTVELWKRGHRFRRNVKDLPGKPDIAIKKYRIVIFLDSCFWHGCPQHCRMPKSNVDFWERKMERNRQRDAEVTQYYCESGWHILRVWEHQLIEDYYGTISQIANFIAQAKSGFPPPSGFLAAESRADYDTDSTK
ncbi:MAG: very short patch repair endonuclease [Solirubrobacterales bacterium]